MEIYEFAQLNINDRAEMISECGIYIDIFENEFDTVKLYSLENYYVEVTVNNSEQKITEVNAFQQGSRLEKYLNRITVEV
jgi:hypothetical protein